MKRWRVIHRGYKVMTIDAETKEEARKKFRESGSFYANDRVTIKEEELYGWALIESMGCSKYD